MEAWCLVAGLELLQKGSERPLMKGKPQRQRRFQDFRDSRIAGVLPRTVESVKWSLSKPMSQGVCSADSRAEVELPKPFEAQMVASQMSDVELYCGLCYCTHAVVLPFWNKFLTYL